MRLPWTAINNSLPAFCNSDNTELVNKFDERPQIYVACLASYNNGIPHGAWLDATSGVEDIQAQIKQLLAKSPMPGAEEFAVHSHSGFGSIGIEEYESIQAIHEKALFIVEHGELGAEVLDYYGGCLEDAKKALEEYYEGEYKNELDYATYLFNEVCLHDIPKAAQWYIDYELFQRDIFINDYFSLDVNGSCHVFRHHQGTNCRHGTPHACNIKH